MSRVEFLEPVPEVCGVSSEPIENWNWINSNLGKQVNKSKTIEVAKKYGIEHNNSNALASEFIYNLCIEEESNCKECSLKATCKSFSLIKPENEVTFADFFCGAGGLSLGFEQAGLAPIIANDIDPWFVSTYAYNRPKMDIEYHIGDIAEWVEMNKNKKFNLDIVSGGAPCQSFSNANRQRVENDPRNKLYIELIKATKIINPKILLIENVGGILKEFEGIIQDLDSIGFKAKHIVVNASEFGIPQNRKRVFFIGANKAEFKDPESIIDEIVLSIEKHRRPEKVSLKEALKDLPKLEAYRKKNDTKFNNTKSGFSLILHDLKNASDYIKWINDNTKSKTPLFNHKARYNNDRDIEIFGLLSEGENSLSEKISHLNPYSNRNGIFKDKYFKLKSGEPCKTITAHMRYDCNMYIHPNQARGLTAREAARVQSFPDDYSFLGNFQRLYQQVGNAVPPKLAYAIGESIKNTLEKQQQ